jgi:hypothetical protein
MNLDNLIGGTIIQMLPLYIVLQILFVILWRGRWRWAALAPLVIFVPTLAYSIFALTGGSNLWPLTMIFFGPLGTVYLVGLALARVIVRRCRAT